MLSLLLPIFNEEHALEETLRRLRTTLTPLGDGFELVVIDDGSTDRTAAILAATADPRMTVLRHPVNRGYSASLKTGIRHSQGDIIGIVDADGTYPLEEFPHLLQVLAETQADMVVGARTKKGVRIPLTRRPAKAIVNGLARLLTGTKIPDLNSGMRVFRRDLAERFMHLYPQRFSFTITITLAALTNDYSVEYVPIDYGKRAGKSTLSAGFNGLRNFGAFLSLIVRMVISFRPLRFFLWPSLLIFGSGIAVVSYTTWQSGNISDSGLLLLVSGLQIGLFGLLAEAVVRSRGR